MLRTLQGGQCPQHRREVDVSVLPVIVVAPVMRHHQLPRDLGGRSRERQASKQGNRESGHSIPAVCISSHAHSATLHSRISSHSPSAVGQPSPAHEASSSALPPPHPNTSCRTYPRCFLQSASRSDPRRHRSRPPLCPGRPLADRPWQPPRPARLQARGGGRLGLRRAEMHGQDDCGVLCTAAMPRCHACPASVTVEHRPASVTVEHRGLCVSHLGTERPCPRPPACSWGRSGHRRSWRASWPSCLATAAPGLSARRLRSWAA